MRAILTYHSIDCSGSPISLDEATFRRHVAWLASGAVRVVPLADISNTQTDDNAVAITFDDGVRNIADVALPLLRDHGLAATVFVVSDAVGGTNAWGGAADRRVPVLPLLDWDTLARLSKAGAAIGSHTRSHAHLSRLSVARIEDEVFGSLERIEAELGVRPATFSYPYGDAPERAVSIAARHFQLACTTELRPLAVTDDPHRLPRLDAHYLRAPGRIEAWGSTRLRLFLDVRGRARRMRQQLIAGAPHD